MSEPRLACVVLIICHNGRAYLDDCLTSVLRSNDNPVSRHVIVVDNASTDGSADWIAVHFPQVLLVRSAANVGFAGGNNLGMRHLRMHFPEAQYVALLNQDTIVISGWLAALAGVCDAYPLVGCAQPKIMLHPQTDRYNTAGNVSHFLGFGFTTAYGQRDDGQFDLSSAQPPREIGFASGAATLVRLDALRGQTLFNEEFVAYLEDADLSWRLRLGGYRIVLVPQATVLHKYAFKADYRHYYLLERNRWLLIASHYKMTTILLFLPALLIMEAGQLYFALSHGVGRQKVRAWVYFANRHHLARLAVARAQSQRSRRISDKAFGASLTSVVDFPELESALLRRVANPLFAFFWKCARTLMWW